MSSPSLGSNSGVFSSLIQMPMKQILTYITRRVPHVEMRLKVRDGQKIRKAFVCRSYRYNKYVPCFSPLTSTSHPLPSTTLCCFRLRIKFFFCLSVEDLGQCFVAFDFGIFFFIHLFLHFYNYCYLIAVHPSSHSSSARCLCMIPTFGLLRPQPVCKALEA